MAAGRLLILDDDPAIGQTMRFIAEGVGMEVSYTDSPERFFELVDAWQPSHIALDLVMSDMDGVEVLVQLARHACRASIIISSGVGGGTESILLVEDDELVRRYAHEQLVALGYRVTAARDTQEALELLRQHDDIDLMFTDVVMPGGMTGRQLADEAKKLRPRLKVLYTSGYSENVIVHHGRLDPGVRLLGKPYRRIDLARKVREALAGD